MNRESPGQPWIVPAVIVVVCWTLTTHGKYSVSGDEPHYLVVSQSLLADGDLDLVNNHASEQTRRFGVDDLQPGQHVHETRHGRLLPVHDIGLPVALLPVYAVATAIGDVSPERILARFRMSRGLFAYSLMSLFIIAITAWAAVVTRAALIDAGASERVASIVVVAAWLSPPLLSNSFVIFPEAVALLVTAYAVRTAVSSARQGNGARGLVVLVAALGLLPWFHRKYAVYVVALLLAVVWERRGAIEATGRSLKITLLAVFAIPPLLLAAWTLYHWGSLGGPLMEGRAPFTWDAFRVGWLGLLVDRENGLLVWAPIYLLLPAAWVLAGRGGGAPAARRVLWLLPAAALFVISAAHDQWWAGFSPAGRFLVPLIPIFCLAAPALSKHPRLGMACAVLLAFQVLISAYAWQHARALWPQGDGVNRVTGELLRLAGAGDAWVPALRVSPESAPASLALVLVIAALNAGVVFGARRRVDVT